MKKIFYIAIMAMMMFLASCSKDIKPGDDPVKPVDPTPTAPEITKVKKANREIRAVWMATVFSVDWPWSKDAATQKQQYIDYLDLFKTYNINAVIVQIRPTADAFFPSEIEPWSQWLTGTQGQNPGYDVLRFLIDEAHKRGMEFHAWMNPYRVSADRYNYTPAPNSIYATHPEYTLDYGAKLRLLRPGLPEVRKYLIDVIDEVITKYDIDGLHFDDYFYPYAETGASLDDQAEYAKYGKAFASIGDWRRDNVTQAMKEVHELIVSKRPDIVFGVSPFGTWKHASQDANGSPSSGLTNYYDLYADVRLWCEKGYVDYMAPQLYNASTSTAQPFVKMAQWWASHMYNVPVIIGHGIYRFESGSSTTAYRSLDELALQISTVRSTSNIVGSFLYNSNSFKANKLNILSSFGSYYKKPSPVPFMGRKTLQDPSAPAGVSAQGKVITWTKPADGLRAVVYNISTANLATPVAVTSDNKFTVSSTGYYAVTLINEDNVESPFSSLLKI
ncbi:MAG: family 10 glycosylhydrolase [Flavobacteriales bacterium]|nr:family 10 glycosylhydrolase [Flavobacteriales bacterium]